MRDKIQEGLRLVEQLRGKGRDLQPSPGRRTISPAGRRAMSLAAKRRWARERGR